MWKSDVDLYVNISNFMFLKVYSLQYLFLFIASSHDQLFGNLQFDDSVYVPPGYMYRGTTRSPGQSYFDLSSQRISPRFRRTPGASRPNSRTSSGSHSCKLFNLHFLNRKAHLDNFTKYCCICKV